MSQNSFTEQFIRLFGVHERRKHVDGFIATYTQNSCAQEFFGVGIDLYMVKYGIDLTAYTSGFSISGVGMSPIVYGAITVKGVVLPTVILSVTCVLASLYPGIRAARLRPAIGMRET